MKCKISTSPNFVLAAPISLHHYLGPVPPAPLMSVKAPAAAAFELPVLVFHPPGMKVGKNKLSTNVFHESYRIALDGHDCGIFIPHVPFAPTPANALIAIMLAFSSRKVMFSASTVKINKLPAACVKSIAPMMVCQQPISLPVAWVVNDWNTVTVGMTAGDLAAGWAGIVISVVVDLLVMKVGGKGRSIQDQLFKPLSEAKKDVGKELWDALRGKLLGGKTFKEWLLKQAGAAATGFVKATVTGEGTINVGVGSPYAEVKGQVVTSGGSVASGGATVGTAGTAVDFVKDAKGAKVEAKDRSYAEVSPFAKHDLGPSTMPASGSSGGIGAGGANPGGGAFGGADPNAGGTSGGGPGFPGDVPGAVTAGGGGNGGTGGAGGGGTGSSGGGGTGGSGAGGATPAPTPARGAGSGWGGVGAAPPTPQGSGSTGPRGAGSGWGGVRSDPAPGSGSGAPPAGVGAGTGGSGGAGAGSGAGDPPHDAGPPGGVGGSGAGGGPTQ